MAGSKSHEAAVVHQIYSTWDWHFVNYLQMKQHVICKDENDEYAYLSSSQWISKTLTWRWPFYIHSPFFSCEGKRWFQVANYWECMRPCNLIIFVLLRNIKTKIVNFSWKWKLTKYENKYSIYQELYATMELCRRLILWCSSIQNPIYKYFYIGVFK